MKLRIWGIIMSKRNIYFGCFVILTLMAVCFSFAAGGNSNINTNDSNEMAKIYLRQMAQLEKQITTSATQGFRPSLEIKENVDFLLTPALLMQEAMSQEVVITYPTE